MLYGLMKTIFRKTTHVSQSINRGGCQASVRRLGCWLPAGQLSTCACRSELSGASAGVRMGNNAAWQSKRSIIRPPQSFLHSFTTNITGAVDNMVLNPKTHTSIYHFPTQPSSSTKDSLSWMTHYAHTLDNVKQYWTELNSTSASTYVSVKIKMIS